MIWNQSPLQTMHIPLSYWAWMSMTCPLIVGSPVLRTVGLDADIGIPGWGGPPCIITVGWWGCVSAPDVRMVFDWGTYPLIVQDAVQAPFLITLRSPLLLSYVMLFGCTDSNVSTIKAPFQCKCCQLGSGKTGPSLPSCMPQSITKALPLLSTGPARAAGLWRKGEGDCSWGCTAKGG